VEHAIMNDQSTESDEFPEQPPEQSRRRRTIWIWMFFALGACSFLASILRFNGLDLYYYVITVLANTLFFAGSLALLFFRTIAIRLFVIACLTDSTAYAYHLLHVEYLADPWVFTMTEWLESAPLYVATILYSLRLKRRGWLHN
jgi:hypothetical protein